MTTFKDKVVLITGASGGMGKAIAQKFAKAGAKIALNDISLQEENLKKVKEEVEKLDSEAKYYFADVSKLEEVEKMVQNIQSAKFFLDTLNHFFHLF